MRIDMSIWVWLLIRFLAVLLCLISPLLFAASPYLADTSSSKDSSVPALAKLSPLYVGAYGGYGLVSGAYGVDGQTTQGRFALGVDAYTRSYAAMGVEVGVQTGNIARLEVDSALIDAAGGLPLQTVLKPFPDLLLFLRFKCSSFSIFAKGGIAYRQLQFENRTSSQDTIRRINCDIQVGFGYQISRLTRFTVFYQGIYSDRNASVTSAPNSDLILGGIPTQQSGWLGIEHAL